MKKVLGLLLCATMLLGLMAVMLLFQLGGEGWYVMRRDLWFPAVAALDVVALILGFLWFRAAFPVRGSDKV